MLAAGNIGVGQFVDQDDVRLPGDDGVDIHFFEDGSFVFDDFARDGFDLRGKFFDSLAAVGFHDADDDVFAATPAAQRFAEHAVRFAHARGVAEKKLEYATRFLRRRSDFQPVLGLLWQGVTFSVSKRAYDRIAACRDCLRGRVFGFAVSLAIVAVITVFFRHARDVNQTTIALTFLLAILAVSAVWGMAVSVFMSVAAVLSFNYFFLPPVGTFTIADPQNWVALFAFLVTSIMGSQLSARIRKEADEAHQRRREIERLYRFSQKLLAEGNVIQLMNAIPNYIVESFEGGAAELFLPQKDKFYRSGFGAAHLDEEKMKSVFLRDEGVFESQEGLYFIPVRMGVRPIASLGISGSRLSRQTLDAVGSLVAIAIERARAVEKLGETEAERQGERLKSALLDSIAHDFRTPLTSIKAATTGLAC